MNTMLARFLIVSRFNHYQLDFKWFILRTNFLDPTEWISRVLVLSYLNVFLVVVIEEEDYTK